jgi:uncharacterized protein involved in outer membrane biogenesis
MKKIFKILLIIVVILILAFVAILFFKDAIITSAINKVGDSITKTNVSLESIETSFSKGSITINNFSVANPNDSFSGKDLASFGKVFVEIERSSVFSDVVVIKNIIVEKPYFSYEFNSSGENNLKKLLSNIQSESSHSINEERAEHNEKLSHKVIIKNLEINSPKVSVASNIAGVALRKEINIPSISLKNLGTEQSPTTFKNVANELSATILDEIVKSEEFNINSLSPNLNKEIKKIGDRLEGKLKNIF